MVAPGGIVIVVARNGELGGLPMGKVAGPDAEGGRGKIKDDAVNACQYDLTPECL
jgi:hypothetical protein